MTKTQAELALEALEEFYSLAISRGEEVKGKYIGTYDKEYNAIKAALTPAAPQKDETGMPREIWVVGDAHNFEKHWFDFPVTCSEKYLRADLVEKDRK